jgi:hypothetical protein
MGLREVMFANPVVVPHISNIPYLESISSNQNHDGKLAMSQIIDLSFQVTDPKPTAYRKWQYTFFSIRSTHLIGE